MVENISKDNEGKKEYEVSFLVREEAQSDAVRSLMTRHGGEISFVSPLRRIALAYPIKKETHAYFGFFYVVCVPETIVSFGKDLRTSGIVLRSLMIIPTRFREKKAPLRGPTAEAPQTHEKTIESLPLSNEALERKIEEILQ